MAPRPQYRLQDYTVGWLCALPIPELTAARMMLEHEHEPPVLDNRYDDNQYHFGDIYKHNVVMASMPPSMPGLASAQKLIEPLRQTFPNMGLHLFVGVGGGIPRNPSPTNPLEDIHLGDVVIGWPELTGAPAVVQHDFIRLHGDGRDPELLSYFNKPDLRLLNSLGSILSDRDMGRETFHRHLKKLAIQNKFQRPEQGINRLFEATSLHIIGGPKEDGCRQCTGQVDRPKRELEDLPQFHRGTILSGNRINQHAEERDKLSQMYHGAICIEMEAAGVIDYTHCLVIRGISDYADSHRVSLAWHYYAAGTAAAFAREILYKIPPATVETLKPQNNDVRYMIAEKIEEGKSFYSRFQRSKARDDQDLYFASRCFREAHDLLTESNVTDPTTSVSVLFRLMTIETDISHDPTLNLEERINHNRRANDYGDEALNLPSTGVVTTQIRLEQAFVKGRMAELEEKRETNTVEITRMKKEAWEEIQKYFAELNASDPDTGTEYETRMTRWVKRLQ